uniref:DNA mismatch repair protein MSH6 n=1 Tax=Lingulaulax polyedra TaxID=160621 RepID=A0A516AFW6_LINPO|nr:DNA mismatch repair protein MSH6 [Lingulodinium polyedra]
MAAQSPLGRFFTSPGAGTGGSPHTPTSRAGGGALARAGPGTPLAPSSAGEGRKRGAAAQASLSDSKKPRAAAAAAPAADGPSAVCLPVVDEAAAAALPGPRAAAQRPRPADSKLPAFVAECFHHYNTGGSPYSWPEWLKPESLRDAQGRAPTDPGFDQGTLRVPGEKAQKDSGHGTPMLLQYWKLKAAHFDKIALFKVGKFYELFYYDAFIAQGICNLKWMSSDKRPHVGFPEMAKHDYAKQIVDAGFKVVVVEQVERVAEKQAKGATTGPTCVERDACEVFTKGTLVDPELLGGSAASYMAFLHFEEATRDAGGRVAALPFSACLVDAATSQLHVGSIVDAPDRNALRTLLAQIQPSEVVYSPANMPMDVLGMVRRLPFRPQLSAYRGRAGASAAGAGAMAARDRLQRYRGAHPGRLPEAVERILNDDGAAIAAAGAMDYLDAALLGNRVLPFAVWDTLDAVCSSSQATGQGPSTGKRMVLDATALAALEVLETLEGSYKGSLLEFMDHTSMPCGLRLLRQWLCAPLREATEIRARQEAVEFLLRRPEVAQQLKNGLKKVPVDLERATSRVWGYALQAERHAVMYEDVTAKRLGDFNKLLRAYEQCLQLLATALPLSEALPGRLVRITRTRSGGGCFPELQAVISRLCGCVVTVPNPKNGKTKFRPADGADAQHDAICRQIEAVKAQLEQELQGLRARFPQVPMAYVHRQPGFRYEVECDEKALPQSFMQTVDVTSKQRNNVRFQTPHIKQLIGQLDNLEDQREDCIFPFLSKLFQEFHAHQALFRAAVRCLSELDALLSLATVSQGLAGASCRPEIVEAEDPNAPGSLELRACSHPVAAAKMGSSFVPNDTLLNASGVPGVLVVTGPNMGGKSTVLRQTCVAVMMAQLGCRVNAQLCRLTPVDRIFTRIGSYDAILEGKSTLLTELEETAAVLAHGSRRSLAVLDELGRGTSTFDGAAIASAVLDDLAERVGCNVLFATHYHPVSRRAAASPLVAPFHMAAEVDEATQEMTFLYRFLPGLCPASYGHNVARLAGLPQKVLEEARAKSAEFEGREAVGSELARLVQLGDAAGLRALFRQRCQAAAA